MAGRWLGWLTGEVWKIGWLLQTEALIMIIVVTIFLGPGVLYGAAFTELFLMATGSTLLSMPIVNCLPASADTPRFDPPAA